MTMRNVRTKRKGQKCDSKHYIYILLEIKNMEKYIWESERDIQDVIKDCIALTDKPNIIDRNLFDYIKFDYKYLGADGYKFSLWFHYAWSRASYQPVPINGIIRSTKSGCRIEAHKQRWFSIIDSVFLIAFITVCYLAAITAPIAGFRGSIAVSIMFAILATIVLIRFLYTRKQWESRDVLLDIIDRATNVERKQRY